MSSLAQRLEVLGLWTALALVPGCDATRGDDPDSPRVNGAKLEPGLEARAVANYEKYTEQEGWKTQPRICDPADPNACLAVAHGFAARSEFREAASAYETACDGGVLLACSNLGRLLSGRKGVAPDIDRAAALFKTSCKDGSPGGSPAGCANLGDAYRSGQGVSKDEKEAVRLYTLACTSGEESQGCNNLGVMQQNGRGTALDLKAARKSYALGCRLGAGAACSNLAVLYRDGAGGPKDRDYGIELSHLACKLKHEASCELFE